MQGRIQRLQEENRPRETEVIEGHLLMEYDPVETDKESVKEISREFKESFYENETLSGETTSYGLSIRKDYFNAR